MLLVLDTNLQGVLLPILAHERGAGTLAIGLFSAGWSSGFVIACPSVGRVLGHLGPMRGFVGLAVLSAAASALLSVLADDRAWIVLRVVIGFCYGGLSAIVEGWLIEIAGSGIAFAGYMVATLRASLLGTLSLAVLDVSGALPFLLAVASGGLSAVPVALGRIPRPPAAAPFSPSLGMLLRRSPVAGLACIGAGLVLLALGTGALLIRPRIPAATRPG